MDLGHLQRGTDVAEPTGMRLPHVIAALGAVLLAVSGCADSGASSDVLVEEGADGKLDADSRAIIGSWNIIELSSEPNPDVWLALVLKTDKTFYLWPEQGDGFQGTYKLERTQDADPPERFVVLTTETGDELRREYKVEDGTLFLRNPSGSWREMEKSERAVCVAVEDCTLQNLKKPACVGSWGCDDEGQCAYTCE
jgi:hypothetical protein